MAQRWLLPMAGIGMLVTGVALAAHGDHGVPIREEHPHSKIFQWVDARAGDCHLDGTLTVRPNGSASFQGSVWTHTHGPDVWHSNIELRGPGGVIANSGRHDSPGMPHNHDGPGNRKAFNFDFGFPAGEIPRHHPSRRAWGLLTCALLARQ